MKKVLSAVLAGAMLASMASVSAFALSDGYVNSEFTGVYLKDDKDVKDGYLNGFTSKPDNTYYYVLGGESGATAPELADSDYFSFKYKKDEGSKMIKSIKLIEKDVDDNGSRENVVEVVLNDDYTDKETKVQFTVTLTAKGKVDDDKAPDGYDQFNSGDKIYFPTHTIYVTNQKQEGDYDWSNGTGGYIAKPTKDDDNEVTWENQNDTVARLTFVGDSDVNKYYPKLSTRWDNQDYATYFLDRDAYLFDFVANPTVSSTSRAVLEIYNPFVNEDGDETVDPENVRILTIGDTATMGASTEEMLAAIDDGRLVDITSSFAYGENDDGDLVYQTKTRTLGTYIFVDMEEIVADEIVTPDDNTAPVIDTKLPPVTGRF